ncbi:hypothetical protein N865_16030 [Intrasporangium oryzae NRRL B-24470]|uniref:Uncharacterized protein n=1 Tax=Intrasporangium oryzae NRRL B-24470 TaxID=1386089 RepID=W9G916_9MICO|nr:hypothetical protein [Intrasporangium oryzae]EWT00364.1 hypothetical protein N865_16030 [Intrasporangium oryzae NRRL B-24470]
MGTNVRVGLGERGADAERLDVLHRQLGDQLRSVDGLAVRTDAPEGVVPDGSRALDPATVSSLAVAVLGSGGLAALLASLRSWLGREQPRDQRTVRIEVAGDVLELTGASSGEQDRLVALFLARHEVGESS